MSSNENQYYCELKCPKEFPFQDIQTQKCVEKCDIKNLFMNQCIINNKEKNNEKTDNLGKQIVEEILNGNLG